MNIIARFIVSAEEAIALEEAGQAYDMPAQQVATIAVPRWLGLNRKPPAAIFAVLSGIRAEVRRIGVNVNQLAHARNRLLTDPRLRRQDDLLDQLGEIGAFKAAIGEAMALMHRAMGLDHAYWGARRRSRMIALTFLCIRRSSRPTPTHPDCHRLAPAQAAKSI